MWEGLFFVHVCVYGKHGRGKEYVKCHGGDCCGTVKTCDKSIQD